MSYRGLTDPIFSRLCAHQQRDPGPRDSGAVFASTFWRAASLALLSLFLMNCIVLDPYSPEQEFLPPTIRSPLSAYEDGLALDQIIEVRRTDDDGDFTFDRGQLEIPLLLTYGDDSIEFQYRVFLDLQRGNEESAISISGGRIPGRTGEQTRSFSIGINYDNLGGHGCHRLSVVATPTFQNPGIGSLAEEGQPVAQASVFVNVLEPLLEPPLVEDCPR